MENIKIVLFFLILLEIILSTLFLLPNNENIFLCSSGSCNEVQTSKYAQIFDIKVANLGFASFTALLILFILACKKRKFYKLFLIAAYLGALFAVYFLLLQFFVIKSICKNCLIIDTTMLIIAGISTYDLLKNKAPLV